VATNQYLAGFDARSYRKWSAAIRRLLLAILLVSTTLLLVETGWLWRWDNAFYDAQLGLWQRAQPEDIVIIAIDDASLAELGGWPWPAEKLARLLDPLAKASIRGLALDIIPPDANGSDASANQRLADALRRFDNSVLAVRIEVSRAGGGLVERVPNLRLSEAATTLGHANVALDQDGMARRVFLWEGAGNDLWPVIGLALLNRTEPGPDQRRTQPAAEATPAEPPLWIREQGVLVPFAGPPGHFKHISISRVLRDDYVRGSFRNKFVLVGTTASGTGDAVPTPVAGFAQPMSNVEFMANVLDATVADLLIRPATKPWHLAFSGIFALLPFVLFPFFSPRVNIVVTASLMLGALIISLVLLLSAHYFMPPAAAMVAVALGYLLWSSRRLENAVHFLGEELAQFNAEHAGLQEGRKPGLESALEFLEGIVPMAGWCVIDDSGEMRTCHGRSPIPLDVDVRGGSWTQNGDQLWSRIWEYRQSGTLGIRWKTFTGPTPNQKALLNLLIQQYTPDRLSPALGTTEVVQARIEEVQNAIARLRTMRRFLNDSLAQMADGVVVTSGLGEVLLSNDRAASYLCGDSHTDIKGGQINVLMENLDMEGGKNWNVVLSQAVVDHTSVHVNARNQEGQDLLVQIAPLTTDQSGIAGVIINLSDISSMKASERMRSETLSFLSHDLRSPLVSLLALLEMARNTRSPDEITTMLSRMETYAERTLSLAEQFTQLARVESTEALEFRDVDFVTVALNAYDHAWVQAKSKGIDLAREIGLDDAWVKGDASLLERAILNLLGNAIKYSPSHSKVLMRLYRQKEMLWCCVEDQGYGIASDEVPRLFDRFHRAHLEHGSDEEGIGLGLALVEATADRHGGYLEVESQKGSGSRFCIVLPEMSTEQP
jgi:signal transduction histidine kinase/CHASE2 domain-containing sensor protein